MPVYALAITSLHFSVSMVTVSRDLRNVMTRGQPPLVRSSKHLHSDDLPSDPRYRTYMKTHTVDAAFSAQIIYIYLHL